MPISDDDVQRATDGHEIGGADGYEASVTLDDADRIVDSKAELLDALDSNRDVIGIASDARIDMSAESMVDIGSKTLVSDRQDRAAGGLIYTNSRGRYGRDYYTIFCSDGSPHLSGLRIRGPRHDADFTRWDYNDNLARAIELNGPGGEIENCELWGWTWNAIDLSGDSTRTRTDAEIHHNHLHKSYQIGYGYLVDIHRGFGHIHHNYMNEARHCVDGYGWANSGYIVENNIFGPRQYSHQVDMHCLEENRARGRKQDQPGHDLFALRAGGRMEIRDNWFLCDNYEGKGVNAIAIRGAPAEGVWIEGNKFVHSEAPRRNPANNNGGEAWRQVNVTSSNWDVATDSNGWTPNWHVGDNEFGITSLGIGNGSEGYEPPKGILRSIAEVLSRG